MHVGRIAARAVPLLVLLAILADWAFASTMSIAGTYNLDEYTFADQQAVVQFDLSGDTWVNPMPTTVRQKLIATFFETTPQTLNSFRAQRGTLLQTHSFAVTTDGASGVDNRLTVTFDSAPNFDVHMKTRVVFSPPSVAFDSGTAPTNNVTLFIHPNRSQVSMEQVAYTFTEDQIRVSGAVAKLTLTGPERWLLTSHVRVVANESHVWRDFGAILVNRSQWVIDGRTLNFVIPKHAVFDTHVPIGLSVSFLNGSVAYTAPTQTLQIAIVPSPGRFWFTKPFTVAESSLYADAQVVNVPLYLEFGEKWRAEHVNGTTLQRYLLSSSSESTGFNALKGTMVRNYTISSTTHHHDTLTLHLHSDKRYNIRDAEEVRFLPSWRMVRGNLAPTVVVGGVQSDRFSIAPSAAALVSHTLATTEAKLHTGRQNITLTLKRGERFLATAQLVFNGSFSSNLAETSTSFMSQLPTMLPVDRFKVSTDGNVMAADTQANMLDIAQTETITMALVGGMVESNVAPSPSTFTITVAASPDLLRVAHPTGAGPVFTMTEDQWRRAPGTFAFTWAWGWETWSRMGFNAQHVVVTSGDTAWAWALTRRYGRTFGNTSTTLPLTYSSDLRTMSLGLKPDPWYDTRVTETVRITIPTAAISSGIDSADGRTFFDVRITPSSGSVHLASPRIITDLDMREGVTLIYRLHAGETFVAGYGPSWKAAFVSSRPSEPYGFQQNLDTIFNQAKFALRNDSRETHITLGPLPHYSLQSDHENVTVRLAPPHFPLAAFRSGLQVRTQTVSFTITKATPQINVTLSTGSRVLTEDQVRAGGWRVQVGLAAHEQWDATRTAAWAASFRGDAPSVAGTGWTSQIGSIFPPTVVDIPATRTAYTATAIGGVTSNYQINVTETVTLQFPPSVFLSHRYGSNAATFTVVPSRGTLGVSVDTFSQSLLVVGRSPVFELKLVLSGNERWNSVNATRIVHSLARGSDNGRFGFNALKSRLLARSNVTIVGQHLVLRFTPSPWYGIKVAENITFLVPSGATASGIVPRNGKYGLGRVVVRVEPTPPVVSAVNATMYESRLAGKDTRDGLVIAISGGAFVSSGSALEVCSELIKRNLTAYGTDAAESRYLTRRIRELVVGARVDPANPTHLKLRLTEERRRGSFAFDISKPIALRVAIPRDCVGTRILPRQPWVVFRVVPTAPVITVIPNTITERDIRTQAATRVRFQLSQWGKWRSDAPDNLRRAMRITGSPAEAWGFERRVNVTRPMFELKSPTVIEMTLMQDSYYDIAAAELLDFKQLQVAHSINASGTVAPDVSMLTFSIMPSPPQIRIVSDTQYLRQLELRSKAPALPKNLTVRLEYGERFTASYTSVAFSLLHGVPNDFARLSALLATTNLWSVHTHPRPGPQDLTIPFDYTTAPLFELAADLSVLVKVPGNAVASGLTANNSNALIRIPREAMDRMVVSPAVVHEYQLRNQKWTDIEVIMGARPSHLTVNDTFTTVCALGPGGNVVLQNASRQAAAAAEPRGFFGSRMDRRALLVVTPSRLKIRLPREEHIQVHRPETIHIVIGQTCLTSKFRIPRGALSFRVVPTRATAVVSVATTATNNQWSTSASTAVPETDFTRGIFRMNITLSSSHDRFAMISNGSEVVRLVSHSFVASSSVFKARLYALLSRAAIELHPTYLYIHVRADSGFDVRATAVSVSFAPVPELLESRIVPYLHGWTMDANHNAATFTVLSTPGAIGAVATSPVHVTEASVRSGGASVIATLLPGEEWITNTSLLAYHFARAMEPHPVQNAVTGRRFQLVHASRIAVSADRRSLTITLLDTQYQSDDDVGVVFPVMSATVVSGRGVLTPRAIVMNISALPGVVTMSNTRVALPQIHQGKAVAFIATITGDEWTMNIGDTITSTGSFPVAVAPLGYNAYKARLFNPKHNVTRLSATQLRFDVGPYHGYHPPGNREVISFELSRFASRRMRRLANPVLNLTVAVPHLDIATSPAAITDDAVRMNPLTVRIRLTDDVFLPSGCSGSTVATMTSRLDNERDGSSDPHSFASLGSHFFPNTSIVAVKTTEIVFSLNRVPTYRPCAGRETVRLVINPKCFDSGLSFGNVVFFTIHIRNATTTAMVPAFPNQPGIHPVGQFPGRFKIEERHFRQYGIAFNVTLSHGDWAFASPSAVANYTSGSLPGCPTCVDARKSQITGWAFDHANNHPIRVVRYGKTLLLRYAPDAYYDAPGDGDAREDVFVNNLWRLARCPARPTLPLQFAIIARDPSIAALVMPRDVAAGQAFHVTVSGVDLTRLDALRFAPARYNCSHGAMLPTWVTNPDTATVMAADPPLPPTRNSHATPFVSSASFVVKLDEAQQYRVCYAHFTPSRGRHVPFVDLSQQTGTYLRIRAVVRSVTLPTNASAAKQEGNVGFAKASQRGGLFADVPYRYVFHGRGLRARAPGDWVRFAEITSSSSAMNCSGHVAAQSSRFDDQHVTAGVNISMTLAVPAAGRFAVCYKPVNSTLWHQLATVRIRPTVTVTTPRFVDPNMGPAVGVTVHGHGLDTRRGRDRLRIVLDLPSWLHANGAPLGGGPASRMVDPCSANGTIATALDTFAYGETSSWAAVPAGGVWPLKPQTAQSLSYLRHSVTHGDLMHFPLDNLMARLAAHPHVPLQPWKRWALTAVTVNATGRPLGPGAYAVCYSTNSLENADEQLTRAAPWTLAGRLRVFSHVRSLNASSSQPPVMRMAMGTQDPIATYRVHERIVLRVAGDGFMSGPGSKPTFVALTHNESTEASACMGNPASKGTVVTGSSESHVTDESITLHLNATVAGWLTVCWTTPERVAAGGQWAAMQHIPYGAAATGSTTTVPVRIKVVPVVRGMVFDAASLAGTLVRPSLVGSGLSPLAVSLVYIDASLPSCPTPAEINRHPMRIGFNATATAGSTTALVADTRNYSTTASYTPCVAVMDIDVIRLAVFNITSNVFPLVQTLYHPHAAFNVTLHGHGFDTMPDSGDRVTLLPAETWADPANCARDAPTVTPWMTVVAPKGLRATTAVHWLAPRHLPSGNYTVCYAAFPDRGMFRSIGNVRVATQIDGTRLAPGAQRNFKGSPRMAQAAVVGTPFTLVVSGEDLSAWAHSSTALFLQYVAASGPDANVCETGANGPSAASGAVLEPQMTSASYRTLNATFSAAQMGHARVCYADRDIPAAPLAPGDPSSGLRFRHIGDVTVLPSIELDPSPATIFAGVSMTMNLRGLGLNATRVRLGFRPASAVLASGDVCPPARDFDFVIPATHITAFDPPVAGQEIASALNGRGTVTFDTAQRWAVCAELLDVVVPLDTIDPTVSFAGIAPAFVEPNVADDEQVISVFGRGFNSVTLADTAAVVAVPNVETLASDAECISTASRVGGVVQLVSTPGPTPGPGISSATIALPTLLPGNYTVCLSVFPTYAFAPYANLRVFSRVTNMTASRTVYTIGDTSDFLVAGEGFADTPNAVPAIRVAHAVEDCGVISSDLPPLPPLAFPVPTSAAPAWPAVGPVPTRPLPTITTTLTDGAVDVLADNLLNVTVDLPLMGEYVVCWTTPARRQHEPSRMRGPVPLAASGSAIAGKLVLDARVTSSSPDVADAGSVTEINVDGQGLFAPQMNASAIVGTEPCPTNPAAMTFRFDADKSSSTRAVLPLYFNRSGEHRLCVGTIVQVFDLGIINVSAVVDSLGELSWERFEPLTLNLTGAGLTLDDEVYVSRLGCSTPGVKQQIYNPAITARDGLTMVHLDFDTSELDWRFVCFRPALSQTVKAVLGVRVTPEIKEVHWMERSYNPTGDVLTVTVYGRGLNTTSQGDAVRLISGSTDCSTSLATVVFTQTTLDPTSAVHQHVAIFSWTNAAFPNFPDTNYTVCYLFAGARTYVYAGYVALPVANQAPWFNFSQPTFEVLSRPQIEQITVPIFVTGVSAGPSIVDRDQALSFSVQTNVSVFFPSPPTINGTTGDLSFTLAAGADGVVRIIVILRDDGGTLYGGADMYERHVDLRVTYAVNTAPIFTVSNYAYARSTTEGEQRTRVIGSVRPGANAWESGQGVVFTTNVTTIDPYVSSLRVEPDGTAVVVLNKAATEVQPRSFLVPFAISAEDDGGRGISGQEPFESSPQTAYVEVVVFNNAPTFVWSHPADAVVVIDSSFVSPRPVATAITTGARDVGQTVQFLVDVAREDPTDLRPYDCAVSIAVTDGLLRMRCDTIGNFTVTIVLADDGGASLGGSNRSMPVVIHLFVVDPFTLTVDPATGGRAQQTLFTFSAAGGAPWVATLISMELRMLTSPPSSLDGVTVSTLSSVMMRSRGSLLFTTDALPEGTLTFYARIWDHANQTLAYPTVQVQVLKMSTTQSLGAVTTRLRSQIALDPLGASFGIMTASSALPSERSPDHRRDFLQLLQDAMLRRAQDTPLFAIDDALLYATSLANIVNTAGFEVTAARISSAWSTRRKLQQAQEPVVPPVGAAMPLTDVRFAAEVATTLTTLVADDIADRRVTNAIAEALSMILRNIPQETEALFSATDEQARRDMNRAAAAVLDATQVLLKAECTRMRVTTALTAYTMDLSAAGVSVVSFYADIVTAQESTHTATLTAADSVGDMPMSFTFATGTSPTCVTSTGLLLPRTMVSPTADLRTKARAFPWTFGTYTVTSTALVPNRAVGLQIGFMRGPVASSLADGETFVLRYDDNDAQWASVGFTTRSGPRFVLRSDQFQPSPTSPGYSTFDVGLKPTLEPMRIYAIVVAVVLFLLCIVHFIVSVRADQPMRGKFLMEDHLESLLPLTQAQVFLNNLLLTAPFVSNDSFSIFPRHHRTICFWAVLFAPLLLTTVTMERSSIEWESDGDDGFDVVTMIFKSLGFAVLSVVVARVLWWLFTSSPKKLDMQSGSGSAGADDDAPTMTPRAIKVITANTVFALWALVGLIVMIAVGLTFNHSSIVTEHWSSALTMWLFAFVFLDPCYTALMVLVVPGQFPQIAKRYIHPSPCSVDAPSDVASPYLFYASPGRTKPLLDQVPTPEQGGVNDSTSVPVQPQQPQPTHPSRQPNFDSVEPQYANANPLPQHQDPASMRMGISGARQPSLSFAGPMLESQYFSPAASMRAGSAAHPQHSPHGSPAARHQSQDPQAAERSFYNLVGTSLLNAGNGTGSMARQSSMAPASPRHGSPAGSPHASPYASARRGPAQPSVFDDLDYASGDEELARSPQPVLVGQPRQPLPAVRRAMGSPALPEQQRLHSLRGLPVPGGDDSGVFDVDDPLQDAQRRRLAEIRRSEMDRSIIAARDRHMANVSGHGPSGFGGGAGVAPVSHASYGGRRQQHDVLDELL